MMQGILLDRTVSVWRKVLSSSSQQYVDTQVLSAVRCAIVPISSFDTNMAFARESTHVVWVGYWIDLRKSDELRDGREQPVPEGTSTLSSTFTVNGRRDFRLGIPQRAYYARELD